MHIFTQQHFRRKYSSLKLSDFNNSHTTKFLLLKDSVLEELFLLKIFYLNSLFQLTLTNCIRAAAMGIDERKKKTELGRYNMGISNLLCVTNMFSRVKLIIVQLNYTVKIGQQIYDPFEMFTTLYSQCTKSDCIGKS